MSEVTIRPMESGPYIVQGPVRVVDADGNEYDISGRKSVALCRCGGSRSKPFCDGTHKQNGFTAVERAVPADG
jgi:CDGSH-type Zn-finger protein